MYMSANIFPKKYLHMLPVYCLNFIFELVLGFRFSVTFYRDRKTRSRHTDMPMLKSKCKKFTIFHHFSHRFIPFRSWIWNQFIKCSVVRWWMLTVEWTKQKKWECRSDISCQNILLSTSFRWVSQFGAESFRFASNANLNETDVQFVWFSIFEIKFNFIFSNRKTTKRI